MASATLNSFIDIVEPSSYKSQEAIAEPPPAHKKPLPVTSPTPIELDNIKWGAPLNGPGNPSQETVQDPRTPNELENLSRSSSQDGRRESFSTEQENTTGNLVTQQLPSWRDTSMNKWRILSACLMYFANGMNDSGRFTLDHKIQWIACIDPSKRLVP
jgi:hypothetical protein